MLYASNLKLTTASMRRPTNVILMLEQRHRRCANIKTTLVQNIGLTSLTYRPLCLPLTIK